MQSTCRSLTQTKQNVHQGTNPVAAVLFVIITKKRSTSFDHKTKGARLINKKKFSYEDQTRITSLSDLIKWTELQFLSYVSLRNRHLWNTELLIYSLTFRVFMLRQIANSHDSRRPSRRIKQTRPNKSLKIPLSFKIRDINICINRWWFEPGGIYISRKHFHRSFWSVTNDRFNNNKESKCAVFNTNHMCANLFHWGTEIWFLKLQTVSTATNYFFSKQIRNKVY